MALVVSGLLNKQVAGELGISEITVKAHRGRVMQKMQANSVADLVRKAVRLGPARVFGSSSAAHRNDLQIQVADYDRESGQRWNINSAA
jgi:hypothetical protein